MDSFVVGVDVEIPFQTEEGLLTLNYANAFLELMPRYFAVIAVTVMCLSVCHMYSAKLPN